MGSNLPTPTGLSFYRYQNDYIPKFFLACLRRVQKSGILPCDCRSPKYSDLILSTTLAAPIGLDPTGICRKRVRNFAAPPGSAFCAAFQANASIFSVRAKSFDDINLFYAIFDKINQCIFPD